MADLKDLSGKNQLDKLIPAFLWEMGLVATHGNTKYVQPYNWQDGERRTYTAAIMRHLLQYMAGEMMDDETGYHHMAHLANSAMFLYWMDCGEIVNYRPCLCTYCHPTNGHSTQTTLGS